MKKNNIAILLGIVCTILVYAIAIQLKTVEDANKTVASSMTENGLRDEVLKWKDRYEKIYEQLQTEEKKLEKVRQEAVADDESSAGTREELKLTKRLLGFTELTGKGVTIVLDDNKTQSVDGITTGNVMDYIVHDDDLLRIINDIKNAEGVEAIAVNNQRIVSTTGIVCDGNVVRINGQKVSAPFEIKVIGYPEGIVGALTTPGAILSTLQEVGIVKTVKKESQVTIPKYTGTISIQNLEAVEK